MSTASLFPLIPCPHCSRPMVDDGSMRGQTVACPHCGNHLVIARQELPPVAAPPFTYPSAPALSTYQPIQAEFQPAARHRKKSVVARLLVLMWAVLVGLIIAVETVGCTHRMVNNPYPEMANAHDVFVEATIMGSFFGIVIFGGGVTLLFVVIWAIWWAISRSTD